MATHCRSCGKDIIWIKTENGKSCPVDAEVKFIVEGDDGDARGYTKDGESVKGRWVKMCEHEDAIEVHESHFRTCPHARTWSKRS